MIFYRYTVEKNENGYFEFTRLKATTLEEANKEVERCLDVSYDPVYDKVAIISEEHFIPFPYKEWREKRFEEIKEAIRIRQEKDKVETEKRERETYERLKLKFEGTK